MRWVAPSALALVTSFAPLVHAGPDRDTCVAASEDAQTLKIQGHLSAARAKLAVCADDACPRMVKQDCVRWIEDIDRAMPTIVLGAHDSAGHDLIDVSVQLDGATLTTHLDGKGVQVDPGTHTLRFEAKGLPVHEERIVAREGEKNRAIDVRLGEAPSPPSQQSQPTNATSFLPVREAPPQQRSAVPWVLGAIGLVALAAGVGVGIGSIFYANGLRSGCGQTPALCQQSDVDLGWAMYVFAGVNDGLAGVLIVTSAIMFLTHRSPARAPASAHVIVTPTPRGLSLTGTF